MKTLSIYRSPTFCFDRNDDLNFRIAHLKEQFSENFRSSTPESGIFGLLDYVNSDWRFRIFIGVPYLVDKNYLLVRSHPNIRDSWKRQIDINSIRSYHKLSLDDELF